MPHTTLQVDMAYHAGQTFHHASALLRPVRDVVFDHTPLLQQVVGDTNPKEINKQLALISDQRRTWRPAPDSIVDRGAGPR